MQAPARRGSLDATLAAHQNRASGGEIKVVLALTGGGSQETECSKGAIRSPSAFLFSPFFEKLLSVTSWPYPVATYAGGQNRIEIVHGHSINHELNLQTPHGNSAHRDRSCAMDSGGVT